MQTRWQKLKIGTFLTQIKKAVVIDDGTNYKQVTVRLNNQGVTLRGIKKGSEIATKKQYLIHRGQFIISRIDARNGAFGLIPYDLEGAIVTGDFPVFNCNNQIVSPDYFSYLIKSNIILEACIKSSKGTTNRKRLKEGIFLTFEVSLPPLPEQERIAAKITKIEGKISDFKKEKENINTFTDNLIYSWINNKNNHSGPVRTYLKQVWRSEQTEKNKEYKILGAHWYAEGLYIKEVTTGDKIQASLLYKVKKEDFVYNRLFAWKGAFGMVTDDLDGCYVSGEFPCFEAINQSMCRFILKSFSHPIIWDEIFELSKGTSAISRKRLKEDKFLNMNIQVIPDKDLVNFDKIDTRLNQVKVLNNQTKNLIDALMPSVLARAFSREL